MNSLIIPGIDPSLAIPTWERVSARVKDETGLVAVRRSIKSITYKEQEDWICAEVGQPFQDKPLVMIFQTLGAYVCVIGDASGDNDFVLVPKDSVVSIESFRPGSSPEKLI